MARIIALVTASIFLLFSSILKADEQGLNIFVGPGIAIFGDDDLEHTETGNLGIGYRLSDKWGVEALYSYLNDTDFSTGTSEVDVDGDAYSLGLLYFLKSSEETFQPYLSFGAGRTDFEADSPVVADDEQSTYHAGFGFRQFFTDHLAFRTDLRFQHYADGSENGGAIMLGLDYLFGGVSGASAPVDSGPKDSDGDGVYDNVDQCPDTPAGTKVDATGCPQGENNDLDGDGVVNALDECPQTPAGARVNEKGCQYVIKETVSVELEVLFDTDKSVVKPAFFGEIKRVAEFMTLFPATKATIEGHTDSRGADDYNQRLSQRRADAVKQVLTGEHGIAAGRLNAVGYGESQPRATNETKDGMQQNRRVVAVIKTEVEKKAE